MKGVLVVAGLLLSVAVAGTSPMPLVYERENTGADVKTPPLPAYAELTAIPHLPDPFLLANGRRMTRKDQWRTRRAEIAAQIEQYGAGAKPGRPAFTSTFSGDTLTVTLGEGERAFTMSAVIHRPAGAGVRVPAVIGVLTPTGALPAAPFEQRGIATITYRPNDVAPTSFRDVTYASGTFAKLYPDATAGSMMRWAWGVSRLIDALEQHPEAGIDTRRLAVSGCSFAGKIALFAGAFDERIALTLPQESGGGGTISWRYADMLEKRDGVEVENLIHAQGGSDEFPWYARALRAFKATPDRLPYDQHELIALIAPRAVLMLESTRVPRMGAEAARIDALAAREVWKALAVPDRMGVSEVDTPHCKWDEGFTPDLEAYLDRFLLGKTDGPSTDILRSKFQIADRAKWIPWTTPVLK